VLNYAPCHEDIWWSGGIAPTSALDGVEGSSLTHRPFTPEKQCPTYPLDRRWGRAPESVWTRWRRQISTPDRNGTPVVQPVAQSDSSIAQLSATGCSCIAILWLSLVSFGAITYCVASRVYKVVVYFVIDSAQKLLDTPSYVHVSIHESWIPTSYVFFAKRWMVNGEFEVTRCTSPDLSPKIFPPLLENTWHIFRTRRRLVGRFTCFLGAGLCRLSPKDASKSS
jgi:hypothetical protein